MKCKSGSGAVVRSDTVRFSRIRRDIARGFNNKQDRFKENKDLNSRGLGLGGN